MVGPDSALGGIEWGTASDEKRIYVPIANNGKVAYTLAPAGSTITWGSWARYRLIWVDHAAPA